MGEAKGQYGQGRPDGAFRAAFGASESGFLLRGCDETLPNRKSFITCAIFLEEPPTVV